MTINLKGCEVVQGRQEHRDIDRVGGVQGSEVNGDYGLDLGCNVAFTKEMKVGELPRTLATLYLEILCMFLRRLALMVLSSELGYCGEGNYWCNVAFTKEMKVGELPRTLATLYLEILCMFLRRLALMVLSSELGYCGEGNYW
nr:hypothetical protein CFP56_47602 [Quercus suber]